MTALPMRFMRTVRRPLAIKLLRRWNVFTLSDTRVICLHPRRNVPRDIEREVKAAVGSRWEKELQSIRDQSFDVESRLLEAESYYRNQTGIIFEKTRERT